MTDSPILNKINGRVPSALATAMYHASRVSDGQMFSANVTPAQALLLIAAGAKPLNEGDRERLEVTRTAGSRGEPAAILFRAVYRA